jgi:hypothetical protein
MLCYLTNQIWGMNMSKFKASIRYLFAMMWRVHPTMPSMRVTRTSVMVCTPLGCKSGCLCSAAISSKNRCNCRFGQADPNGLLLLVTPKRTHATSFVCCSLFFLYSAVLAWFSFGQLTQLESSCHVDPLLWCSVWLLTICPTAVAVGLLV